MTRSTTYLSKISKTKKRLSRHEWFFAGAFVALMGLFAIISFAMRVVALPGAYSAVSAELPVVSAKLDDPTLHRFSEESIDIIAKTTAAVVMTAEAFYFGDLRSFTTDFTDASNKFIIQHEDGEPQLLTLVTSMDKWTTTRKEQQQIRDDGLLVLLPSGDIPMPIVIQVLAGLKDSGLYKRVILGGGLM